MRVSGKLFIQGFGSGIRGRDLLISVTRTQSSTAVNVAILDEDLPYFWQVNFLKNINRYKNVKFDHCE